MSRVLMDLRNNSTTEGAYAREERYPNGGSGVNEAGKEKNVWAKK